MAPPKKKETAKAPAKTTNTKLDLVRAIITKTEKGDAPIIEVTPELAKAPLPVIDTGSVVLNYLIGGKTNRYGVSPCPGWPKGRLINLYGMESSGKTTVALTACAEVCKAGGTVMYIDWEHAVDLQYASALGVPVDDPDRFLFLQPSTLEQGYRAAYIAAGGADKHLKGASAAVDLIVFDSVSAGMPESMRDRPLDEVGKNIRPGLIAAFWSQNLPNLTDLLSKNGVTCIAISQLRKNLQMQANKYMDDTTTQGGESWRFYSSVRLKLRSSKSTKQKVFNRLTGETEEVVLSNRVKATMDKCKVSRSAHQSASFIITYGEGIDNLESLVEIAVNAGIMEKGGSWITYTLPNGDPLKMQGESKIVKWLREHPEQYQSLHTKVWDYLVSLDTEALYEDAKEEEEFNLDNLEIEPDESTD
jgi:recombination protein RecA